ncbi:dihydropteroate synthase [bacterium]|nr:dihydropteroate synthase [bacterium]
MRDFLLKQIFIKNIESELINIGYDPSYAFKGKEKFEYKNFKIFDVTSAQANIIKQLALSVGADCATHRQVITGQIENSDCILGGNISQLRIIAKKLQLQPFGLKNLGLKLEKLTDSQKLNKDKTKIVGILNITSDSFSDGGDYCTVENAITHLHELINDGADIVDIGAESTRPGAEEISPDIQLKRILPVLKYIKENNVEIPISIDTRSAQVAKECIKHGASIINDVSGLDFDKNMAEVIAQNPNVKIVIQHSQGIPQNMQDNPQYDYLMDDIYKSLSAKIDYAISNGIKKGNIIVDAGIGFGKTREQNFEILHRWQELKTLDCPVMLGVSRKSLLNMPQSSNAEKDLYTLALNSILLNENIDYIRVHNVKIHRQLLDVLK